MQDLGTLGGRVSDGQAINASGQVTGLSQTAAGAFHAFLWDGTTMLDLGTLGGELGIGYDINAAGQVTGNSSTAAGAFHAFLWDGETLRDLGTLGAFDLLSSGAAAINDSGQVVGFAEIDFGVNHAFLWDGTAMHDLNALIDPTDPLQPFVTLQFGVDINDFGQILADGCDSRLNECHAYLVSPIAAAPDAAAQIEALLGVVLSLNLKAGIGNALDSKLQNALAALNRDQQDNRSAVGILYAFIHSVEAQRGKALTTEQADQLVSAAQDVIDAL
jgi:probable HAF family extracellular repeat protein